MQDLQGVRPVLRVLVEQLNEQLADGLGVAIGLRRRGVVHDGVDDALMG